MLASPATRKEPGRGVEHPDELTAENLWEELSTRLRETLNETTYATWFAEAAAGELRERFGGTVGRVEDKDWVAESARPEPPVLRRPAPPARAPGAGHQCRPLPIPDHAGPKS